MCIVHDPQPAALQSLVPEKADAWIWRCHIDISTPNPSTLARLLPYLKAYPASLFHVAGYVPKGMDGGVHIVPPAIDPLAPKNMALSLEDAEFVCAQFGIDTGRPMICQVSRFDPWKDPMGVIDAYRLVKEQRPDVQLALVGSMASDDPEGWDFYNATLAHADGDPDIHILNNFSNVGAIEVNAFQSLADVVIQKSTREGFGLTVSEALWKGRPFVGGDVGGIPLQVRTASAATSSRPSRTAPRACRTSSTIRRSARTLGRRGKEHVRTHFLTPRYLRDYLKIMHEVLSSPHDRRAAHPSSSSPTAAPSPTRTTARSSAGPAASRPR